MSLKSRVVKILTKLERRATLAEDSVERTEAVVLDVLELTTELKAAAANLSATAERLEAAVREQGRTLGGVLESMHSERQIRAGVGRNVLELSSRLDKLERGTRGGAAE